MHLTFGDSTQGLGPSRTGVPEIKDHPDASYVLFIHLFASACMLTN